MKLHKLLDAVRRLRLGRPNRDDNKLVRAFIADQSRTLFIPEVLG